MEITPLMLSRVRAKILNWLQYRLNGRHADIYEDAAQQALKELYRRRLQNSFDSERGLCKWLNTAAWWHVLNEFKRYKNTIPIEEAELSGSFDNSITEFEDKELLLKLKSKLPPKKAEVIDKKLQGFSFEEIGQALTEKTDTIKHRFNSAVRTMRILWKTEEKKK